MILLLVGGGSFTPGGSYAVRVKDVDTEANRRLVIDMAKRHVSPENIARKTRLPLTFIEAVLGMEFARLP